MNIFTTNILIDTPLEDKFQRRLILNEYPIVLFDEGEDFERLLRDPDFQDVIFEYVTTQNNYNSATLHIRLIKEDVDDPIVDKTYSLREAIPYPKINNTENGNIDSTNTGSN